MKRLVVAVILGASMVPAFAQAPDPAAPVVAPAPLTPGPSVVTPDPAQPSPALDTQGHPDIGAYQPLPISAKATHRDRVRAARSGGHGPGSPISLAQPNIRIDDIGQVLTGPEP